MFSRPDLLLSIKENEGNIQEMFTVLS